RSTSIPGPRNDARPRPPRLPDHRLRGDSGIGRGRPARARVSLRPVARLHLPGRLAGLAVRSERRDLRRAQQRRLVRFRLFPRNRRVRRRREEEPRRLPRPPDQRPRQEDQLMSQVNTPARPLPLIAACTAITLLGLGWLYV